jgi:hypothetical protein
MSMKFFMNRTPVAEWRRQPERGPSGEAQRGEI